MGLNFLAEKKVKRLSIHVLLIIFISLAFSISYSFKPIYDGTQNTYFVHGLIKADLGNLKNGWFATNTDPTPFFSLLVSLTYKYLSENIFYVYFAVLMGIYLFGLQGIISKIFHFDQPLFNLTYIINLTLLIALHSIIFRFTAQRLFGGGWRGILTNLQSGVANQQILSNYFVTSLFAALIVFSLFLFLKKKDTISLIFLVLAATFHPTFLLTSAIIILSYMFIIAKEKNLKSSLKFGVLALVLSLPIILYVLFSFAPTSAEALRKSHNILFHYRIPHHANPKNWLASWAFFKIILIIISLFIIRKTRLFFVVLSGLIFSVGLTALQMITGNKTLALLFPWRLSVVLVPLSFFIILSAIMSRVADHFPFRGKNIKRIISAVCLVLVVFVSIKGIEISKQNYHNIFNQKSIDVMKWVKNNNQKNDMYLIPPRDIHKFTRFRIFTGVPIFIDNLTHPFKDTEVIEWFNRLRLAKRFYRFNFIHYNLLLKILVKKYHITHVVLFKRMQKNVDEQVLKELYHNDMYGVYKIINQ